MARTNARAMRRAILLSKRTSRRIEGNHKIIQLQLHNKINKLCGVTNNKFFLIGPSAATPARNHRIGRAKGKGTYFPTLDTLYVYLLNLQHN